MIYINGRWFIGNREVSNARMEFINERVPEIVIMLINYPQDNDLDIEFSTCELNEDIYYYAQGNIRNMLLFLYNHVLGYNNYTLNDILSDKDLNLNMEIYFKKVW